MSSARALPVVLDLGLLEPLITPVAQRDRLRQRLEAERVLGEPGDRQRARGRAERDDQLVVGQLLVAAADVRTATTRALRVGAGDLAEVQLGVVQLLAQRDDDVARLERPAAAPGSSGV